MSLTYAHALTCTKWCYARMRDCMPGSQGYSKESYDCIELAGKPLGRWK